MSVQSEIDRIITAVGNAYSKVSEKGGAVPASQTVANLATAIESIPSGKPEQAKTLTLGAAAPSTVTPDSGKVLSSVPVELDTSVIKAENIAKDVTMLGVTGTHEGGGGSIRGTVSGDGMSVGVDSPRFILFNCNMTNFIFPGLSVQLVLNENVRLEDVNFVESNVTIYLNVDNVDLNRVTFENCIVTCSQTFYDAFLAGDNHSVGTNFNIV